jgi:hypothetical protein
MPALHELSDKELREKLSTGELSVGIFSLSKGGSEDVSEE